MSKREKLPDDLKELCALCRAGKLFAVQEWIRERPPSRMPLGNFATSPIRIAIERGFHSLVEVLLQENVVDQGEKNDALIRAVDSRNIDLVELLVRYGANPSTVDFETVLWSRHPALIRWFVAHGLDLESDFAIARAFRDKHREFLGVYLSVRDRVDTASRQAAMALRYHAAAGNLKWASLLLWAGADPRLPVPTLEDSDVDEDDSDTALAAAVRRGQFEVVKRIKIEPARDDVTALANAYCVWPNPNLTEMLIKLGADVRNQTGAINSAFSGFEWSLDSIFRSYTWIDDALRCIEILAANGARWRPADSYQVSCLRRALAKVSAYDAIRHLQRITNAGAIEQPVFQELMRTPRMKEILKQTYPGVIKLREYAGFAGPRFRKNRM
jgi:ankyrin repeat protein